MGKVRSTEAKGATATHCPTILDVGIAAFRQVVADPTPIRDVRNSPAGASGGTVMAPVDAIAVAVGELVRRVARKRAFERADAGTRSRPRTPAPAAAGVVVIARAA